MIADSTLALVKQRTDLVALIGETVKLARSGSSYKGLCPFHKEKSGSFYVHPERGFYHCFGCGESGDALTFVQKQNGLDFREALVFLAERAGVRIDETDQRQKSGPSKSIKDEIYAANNVAASFFEAQLGASKSARVTPHHALAHLALAELGRRGMPDLASESEQSNRWMHVLNAFRVGYAPPEWDGLARHLAAQGISPVVGERAGLLVPRAQNRPGSSGHYDRFRHRLMFAVVDSLGRVVAFSGRALDAPTAEESARLGRDFPSFQEKPAKYINSPESAVYVKGEQLFGLYQAKASLREKGEAILVEGNFDVVTLHAQGFDHAVAPLGTAFTPDQARLLKRFAPKVCCLFDGDAAGRKATRAAREPCRVGGLIARVARLPDGTDPDEIVRTQGAAALEVIVHNGRGMLEHLIDDALDGTAFSGATFTERVARVRSVADLLRTEEDPNLRTMAKHYADQLSSRLVMGGAAPADLSELERTLRQALEAPARPGGEPRREAPPQRTSGQHVSRSTLGAIFDFPQLLDDPAVQEALAGLEGDVALTVAALRQHLRAHEGRMDVAEFLANVPNSIHSFASYRLASPRFEDQAAARQNLLENATLLDEVHFKREKAAALTQLPSMADFSDADAALALEIERKARAKRGLP